MPWLQAWQHVAPQGAGEMRPCRPFSPLSEAQRLWQRWLLLGQQPAAQRASQPASGCWQPGSSGQAPQEPPRALPSPVMPLLLHLLLWEWEGWAPRQQLRSAASAGKCCAGPYPRLPRACWPHWPSLDASEGPPGERTPWSKGRGTRACSPGQAWARGEWARLNTQAPPRPPGAVCTECPGVELPGMPSVSAGWTGAHQLGCLGFPP